MRQGQAGILLYAGTVRRKNKWKKCLTFAVGFGILLKLSLRDKRKTEKFGLEPIEVQKEFEKKFLTNASGFDIINKLLMSS